MNTDDDGELDRKPAALSSTGDSNPAARPEPPRITSPSNNSVVLPDVIVSGAGIHQAEVEVYRSDTQALLSTPTWVNGDGSWRAILREPLPKGPTPLTARQKVGGEWSDWAATVQVTVDIAKPVIQVPVSGSVINEARPQVSGTGVSGAKVQLYRSHSAEVIAHPETVVAGGRWSTRLSNDLAFGLHQLTANQTVAGVASDWATNISFTVLPAPVITGPVESVQNQTFTLTGNTGAANAVVHVFKDLTTDGVGQSSPLTGSNWSCPVTLPPGPISLVAHQVLQGQVSDRSIPRVFRIRPPALTAVTVTHPAADSVKFEGSGHGGATVQITVVSGPGGMAPPPATVSGGRWDTTATNWPLGLYSLQVVQKVPDNAGGWIESQPYPFQVSL
jgi:hypothetical protein